MASEVMPSQAGHWYAKDGTPAYTIVGKNGVERPTTLRDAKKLGLVPSVTGIIRCAAALGLENWKQDQAILAALTCPRIEGESDADLLARIKKDAQEQAKKAAERGTQIHAWIESGFKGDMHPDGARYFKSALATIETECGDQWWKTEKSFATPRYGGKVDLQNDTILIDFKTTEKDITTVKTWDEHAMQLAAYDGWLGNLGRRCGILYINVNTAESRIIWIPQDEIERGWKMFIALLDYWYAKNKLEVA